MLNDDRAAKKAEELLPWETFSCETADEETWQQLADGIAAELREAYMWRDAALRLGENLATVGPDHYYDFDVATWAAWADSQTGGLKAEIARLRAELAKVKPLREYGAQVREEAAKIADQAESANLLGHDVDTSPEAIAISIRKMELP